MVGRGQLVEDDRRLVDGLEEAAREYVVDELTTDLLALIAVDEGDLVHPQVVEDELTESPYLDRHVRVEVTGEDHRADVDADDLGRLSQLTIERRRGDGIHTVDGDDEQLELRRAAA